MCTKRKYLIVKRKQRTDKLYCRTDTFSVKKRTKLRQKVARKLKYLAVPCETLEVQNSQYMAETGNFLVFLAKA